MFAHLLANGPPDTGESNLLLKILKILKATVLIAAVLMAMIISALFTAS